MTEKASQVLRVGDILQLITFHLAVCQGAQVKGRNVRTFDKCTA